MITKLSSNSILPSQHPTGITNLICVATLSLSEEYFKQLLIREIPPINAQPNWAGCKQTFQIATRLSHSQSAREVLNNGFIKNVVHNPQHCTVDIVLGTPIPKYSDSSIYNHMVHNSAYTNLDITGSFREGLEAVHLSKVHDIPFNLKK